jgi:aspartyl-tRNA synthetase
MTLTSDPHFLWVTQFPLFTRADEDKEELAKGRWASSHHPFTAPMWEDMDALKKGDVEGVSGRRAAVLSFRDQELSESLGSTGC